MLYPSGTLETHTTTRDPKIEESNPGKKKIGKMSQLKLDLPNT